MLAGALFIYKGAPAAAMQLLAASDHAELEAEVYENTRCHQRHRLAPRRGYQGENHPSKARKIKTLARRPASTPHPEQH